MLHCIVLKFVLFWCLEVSCVILSCSCVIRCCNVLCYGSSLYGAVLRFVMLWSFFFAYYCVVLCFVEGYAILCYDKLCYAMLRFVVCVLLFYV